MTYPIEVLIPIKLIVGVGIDDSVEAIFKKPYASVEAAFGCMLSELEKALSGNEAWKIVYASLLFHFIGIIEQEEKGFSDFQSKINSDRLKEYLRGKIVQISKPLILSFFKWDFNRRSWDEQGLGLKYKKEYISKTIDEIEREINGF